MRPDFAYRLAELERRIAALESELRSLAARVAETREAQKVEARS